MSHPDSPARHSLENLSVSPEEQGMKLLRFLERRLRDHAPKSMLHKWIRTGQVRVNKKRAEPYAVLTQGDVIRIPPFAVMRLCPLPASAPDSECPCTAPPDLGPDLRLIGRSGNYLALAKAAGLATQAGSGTTDSVAGRLRAAFGQSPFIPAPAHRLDKHTSGIVLAGLSYTAQSHLHELFQRGGICKLYLAWVAGAWPYAESLVLRDLLEKNRDASGREYMTARPGGELLPLPRIHQEALRTEAFRTEKLPHDSAGLALSAALPLAFLDTSALSGPLAKKKKATLLLLRLLTGRKHQIRVQLSSRGFALIGDARYGGPPFPLMLLHALSLSLPPEREGEPGPAWFLPPEWPAPFMPDTALLREWTKKLTADMPLCSCKAL